MNVALLPKGEDRTRIGGGIGRLVALQVNDPGRRSVQQAQLGLRGLARAGDDDRPAAERKEGGKGVHLAGLAAATARARRPGPFRAVALAGGAHHRSHKAPLTVTPTT